MDISTQANSRTKWIDTAKLAAIFAVMIDHTDGILYTSTKVKFFSYYSVSLFILIMGLTTMLSYSRNHVSLYKKVGRKCMGILRPYIVATVVYCLLTYRNFDFETVLDHLIKFSITGPFYYVLLYIQLVIISPIVFYILNESKEKKWGFLFDIAGFIVVLLISAFTTVYSNIMYVYGGGGKLFGGSYLILFYIGMWFGKYYDKIRIDKIAAGILAPVSFLLTVSCWWFISIDKCQIDLRLPYGTGFNPPSISLITYSILIAATLFFTEMFLKNYPNGIPMKVMEAVASLGKHTLYIFLYHRLFLDFFIPTLFYKIGVNITGINIRRVMILAIMVIGPLLVEFVFEKIHKVLLDAYGLTKNKEVDNA